MLDYIKKLKKTRNIKRALAVWFFLIFVFSSLGVFFVSPSVLMKEEGGDRVELRSVANAQFLPFTPVMDIPLTQLKMQEMGITYVDKIKTSLWQKFKDAFKKVGAIAYKNALQRMLSRIAYQGAIDLATDINGQKPAIETNWKKLIDDEWQGAVGDYLNNTIGRMWGKDLCKPLNPLAKVRVETTARRVWAPGPPRCSWKTILKNIKDLEHLNISQLVEFSSFFNPSGNELGQTLTIISGAHQKKFDVLEVLKLKKTAEGEFKSKTSKVSGNTITVAQMYSSRAVSWIDQSLIPYGIYTGEAAADAIGIFTNTLTSRVISNIFKRGFNPDGNGKNISNIPGLSGLSLLKASGRAAAEEIYADLGRPDYVFSGPYDVVNSLSCNNEVSQYACTVDQSLETALLQEPPLTVRQALDEDFLHGNWDFGYRADKTGGIEDAGERIYSYRSLVIMRKYRIIPVGWELAAEYFRQFDNSGGPLTLSKLINDYNNPQSPYYKLVDPSWVVKVPETVCRREGSGEHVVSTHVDPRDEDKMVVYRNSEYCADERACIKESADGSRCDFYGYCVEEKSVWDIHGTECSAVYNTCKSFTTRAGGQVNYLTNTLRGRSDGACDASNAGCREYCAYFDVDNGGWGCDDPNNERKYLNRNASDKECSPEEEGCSLFYRIGSQADLDAVVAGTFSAIEVYESVYPINLRKAPSYLSCQGFTDVAEGVAQDEEGCQMAGYLWREDIQACVESGVLECASYALYCNSSDANCEFYKPISYLGPDVPGVVVEDDKCPGECVGYKTYVEKTTFFDPPEATDEFVNLIDTTASTCPAADVGCEEFTNLSEGIEGERIENYSYLRACVGPGESGVSVYYTWESTEKVGGNRLRSWSLLKSNLGDAPCTNPITTANGEVTCADTSIDSCSTNVGDIDYSPECIEFTDLSGSKYKIEQSKVVFASKDCTLLRRTEDQTYYAAILSQSDTCGARSVGCREYKGSKSNNTTNLLYDDFEDGTKQDWEGGTPDNTSLIVGGHSLFSTYGIAKDVTGAIEQGRAYRISFWARAETAAVISEVSFTGNPEFEGSTDVSLTEDWGFYMFDIKSLDRDLMGKELLSIMLDSGSGFYIDNIVLTETQDSLYLIRDSWVTPDSCDEPAEGSMVGCEKYKDMRNREVYLKSFDGLCRDEVVGCEPMIDTKNSSNHEGETYGLVTVLADSLEYIVYDESKKCTTNGCMSLGMMWPDVSGLSGYISYETKYMIVDPDDFSTPGSPLCTSDKMWCDEFMDSSGALEYFEDPHGKECEYKKDDNNSYAWYKIGTLEFCPFVFGGEEGYCMGGRSMPNNNLGGVNENVCSSNDECADYARGTSPGLCSGWTATCPVGQDTCTEFQDRSRPKGCDKLSVYGEYGVDPYCDYYYYLSNTLDTCTTVDPSKGCLPFNEVGGGDFKYFSTKHCSNFISPYQPCEMDSDCVASGETGSCNSKTNTCSNIWGRTCRTINDCKVFNRQLSGICSYNVPMPIAN